MKLIFFFNFIMFQLFFIRFDFYSFNYYLFIYLFYEIWFGSYYFNKIFKKIKLMWIFMSKNKTFTSSRVCHPLVSHLSI